MGIRSFLKKHLPSYRTERRMMEEMEKLRADLREMSKKNEMLFWNAQMLPSETMQQTKERVYLNMPKATGRLRGAPSRADQTQAPRATPLRGKARS